MADASSIQAIIICSSSLHPSAFLAGSWSAPLPRLLPFLHADTVPLSGPMLGCSAIYAPGGSLLARLACEQEGIVLVRLPLLQRSGTDASTAATDSQLDVPSLAGVLGAAAAASVDAGPAAPYATFFGGYVVEPASWQIRVRSGHVSCVFVLGLSSREMGSRDP